MSDIAFWVIIGGLYLGAMVYYFINKDEFN